MMLIKCQQTVLENRLTYLQAILKSKYDLFILFNFLETKSLINGNLHN